MSQRHDGGVELKGALDKDRCFDNNSEIISTKTYVVTHIRATSVSGL